MRILFCNYEYPPLGGGGGVINALLAEQLAADNEVWVITSHGLDLATDEIVNGVRIIRVPVFFRRSTAAANLPSMLAYLPMGARGGVRVLRQVQFDVINTHFAIPSGPVGDWLSRRSCIPNVLSVHGGDLYDPSKWMSPHRHVLLRSWVRRLLLRADRVVGQSRNTIENVAKYYTDRVRPELIPLGIKRPVWNPGRRSAYGLSDDDILLVTVGRLVARKAVDQLVRMVGRLGDSRVKLLVIGVGPQQPELERLAEESGVADQVMFMGFVDEAEKFEILQMSDIFVSTSQHEGFGIVFLEAMASGLPVICYDHGGQTDFLEDGETGGVVPLGDQEAFQARCASLSSCKERRREIGACNQKLVERFYIETCAAQYLELFEQVARDRSMPGNVFTDRP